MSSTVGERLEAVRKALGETQKSMSTRYGLGESTWQTLERDGRLPKTETLTRLAVDGVNVDWLVTGNGEMMRGREADGLRSPENDDMASAVADRMEQLRAAWGMTQTDFAELLGVSISSYHRYRRGESTMSVPELARLDRRGANLHWLVTGEGPMMGGQAPAADRTPAADAGAPAPAGPVVLTADAQEWRAMLITVLRVCQEEGLDMREAVPDKFAEMVDVMIEISKTVPETAAPDVPVAKRPGILKRIAALLLP